MEIKQFIEKHENKYKLLYSKDKLEFMFKSWKQIKNNINKIENSRNFVETENELVFEIRGQYVNKKLITTSHKIKIIENYEFNPNLIEKLDSFYYFCFEDDSYTEYIRRLKNINQIKKYIKGHPQIVDLESVILIPRNILYKKPYFSYGLTDLFYIFLNYCMERNNEIFFELLKGVIKDRNCKIKNLTIDTVYEITKHL